MKYFLVQAENRLVHLPDFNLEIGNRPIEQKNQLGGSSFFVEGRKQPDLCVFRLPADAVIKNGYCHVVDEAGMVRSVLATRTEVGHFQFMIVGPVVSSEDISSDAEAMNHIAQAARTAS